MSSLNQLAVGAIAALASLLLAGCGAPSFTPQTAGELRINAPGSLLLHTGEPFHLAATLAATGEPAAVRWQVVASNNAAALGSGTIAADGLYTPPGVLSRDTVNVTLAALPIRGGPATTTTLTLAPGFAEPLQPENATLAPGASIELRAQLAEVGSGTVRWRLAAPLDTPADLGTLSQGQCRRSSRQFTTCTVTYTAPSLQSANTRLAVVATAGSRIAPAAAELRAQLVLGTVNSNPALHQGEQRGPIALGGSGGNDNDFDTFDDSTGARFIADCCGGTLGALVEDAAGTPYILSNNHVLATADQAHPGDTIDQPGLIDDACVPLREPGAQLQPVGTLRYAVPLAAPGTNVDAAIASVAPSAVRADGAILELAPGVAGFNSASFNSASFSSASLGSAGPAAGSGESLDASLLDGLSVVKSGRTTGLTCSTVDAVDLQVAVDYYKDCAETQPYLTKLFTGQIGIGGDAFADSGDSGALVLDAANAQPIGLLYATATVPAGSRPQAAGGLTLANPIGDVLRALSKGAGSPLTVAGSPAPHPVTCLNYDQPDAGTRPTWTSLPPDEQARVTAAAEAASALRGSRTGVLAVAPGASADIPGAAAVLVYFDRTRPPTSLPAAIAGTPVVPIASDPAAIARDPALWPAAPAPRGSLHLSAPELAAAEAKVAGLAPRLMRNTAIFGVGVSQSLDDAREPALLLLLDSEAGILATSQALNEAADEPAQAESAALPVTLAGMRVRYLRMHRFRMTRSKYIAPGVASSCALRSITAPR